MNTPSHGALDAQAGDETRPIMNIRGERVGLGPIRYDLIPLYYQWSNDFSFSRTTARSGPLTIEQQTALYERVVAAEDTAAFVIYDLCTGCPIGTTDLSHINPRHRTAEFSIGIGDAVYRGKGYGTETTRLMLDFAFTVLGIHNVLLIVYEFNRVGRRAYEKAGFRECGRCRESQWMAADCGM